jgi:1-acyl-sn-glycerol-3-phosphate acyltransferase
LPRFLRILLTGSAFAFFGFFSLMIGLAFMPLSRIGARGPTERIRRTSRLLHRCCRVFVAYMDLVGLTRLHRPALLGPLGERRACVVVANHPSLLDVVMLLSTLPEACFLAKAALFRTPWTKALLKAVGAVPGPDSTGESMDGAVTLAAMIERLEQGLSVIVFPEGTRSGPDDLRRFKRGAFEAALRATVPLQPFAIHMRPRSLGRGQPWYDVPERRMIYRLELLEAVCSEGSEVDSRALSEAVRRRIAEALEAGTRGAGGR